MQEPSEARHELERPSSAATNDTECERGDDKDDEQQKSQELEHDDAAVEDGLHLMRPADIPGVVLSQQRGDRRRYRRTREVPESLLGGRGRVVAPGELQQAFGLQLGVDEWLEGERRDG